MSLKETYLQFPSPPHLIAVEGHQILNNRIRPLLSSSSRYHKISSFFNPHTILFVFSELAQCFKATGNVKLIIGIHDADKLIPILEATSDYNKEIKFKKAVSKIIEENISECESLLSNTRNFVYVLSELIKQNLIEIRIAAPKTDYQYYEVNSTWPINDNTFHPKISIFKDNYETVVMTGSINSTKSGFGKNIEEASFRNSWEDKESTDQYEIKFNNIWDGCDCDSKIFLFNEDLKSIIKEVIEKSDTYKREYKRLTTPLFQYSHFLDLVNEPLFYQYSFKNVRLLPHQIGVYNKILSRWPINGLIADEVGLGKTIEAGAVLKYMSTFLNSRNNCLLVPSSLKYQWQNEMFDLFGIRFFVYENATSSLVFKPENIEIRNVNWYNCFQYKNNVIFSWHYLRNKDSEEFTSEIDTLLIDEAHNARIVDSNNEEKPTQLFLFLQKIRKRVKHLIFLTATPLQTCTFDYVSLLSLFQENPMDQGSIDRIIEINNGLELSNYDKVSAVVEMKKAGLEKYQELSDPFEMVEVFDDAEYIQFHPTTKYTIRNTRDSLSAIGYQDFPLVELIANPIVCTFQQERILKLISNYTNKQLFKIEQIALGLKSIGFVKSMYEQRIVSSFKASYDTLSSRKIKLQKYLDDGYIDFKVDTKGDIDELEDIEICSERIELTEEYEAYIHSEMDAIREVNSALKSVIINKEFSDPKISRAIDIIDENIANGRSILVFSRYTSTTNYIVELLKERIEIFGVFQGDRKQLLSKIHGEINYDKVQLSNKFKNKEFSVLICSDAASEGQNLQTANVLINVDVPWNPARLLQRFGRIDRFGQQNQKIFFYNLVYQNSVEHLMYKRLIGRNNLFRSILGITPDITDESHVDIINELSGEDDIINVNRDSKYRNSLLRLTKDSNIRIHEKILSRAKQNPKISISDNQLRIGDVTMEFSLNFLDNNYLDLHHPILKEIYVQADGIQLPIVSIKNKNENILFLCIKYENSIFPLTSLEVYLDYFINGNLYNLSVLKSYNINDLGRLVKEALISGDFINHDEILFINAKGNHNFYDDLELVDTGLYVLCKP